MLPSFGILCPPLTCQLGHPHGDRPRTGKLTGRRHGPHKSVAGQLRKIPMKGMRHGRSRPGEGYLSPGCRFAACYTDESDAHQRSADQHFPDWEPRRHTGNVLDLLSQQHAWAAPCGQERDQATRNSPRIRLSPSSARQPHDQRSQSLCGRVPGELGQFGCLLPGMEVQSRKRREDAERHFISLHADRRVEKVVELGSKEGNGSSGIHDDHQWCDGTLLG
jgi:hypothetical protein